MFSSLENYNQARRNAGLDSSEGASGFDSSGAPGWADSSSDVSNFAGWAGSIADSLFAEPRFESAPASFGGPTFANTGAYVESVPQYGPRGHGGYYPSEHGFTEQTQENPGFLSFLSNLILGSPERTYDSGNTYSAWAGPSSNDVSFAGYGESSSGGYGGSGSVEPPFATPTTMPRPAVDQATGNHGSTMSTATDEADSTRMLEVWAGIRASVLKHTDSNVRIQQAIENLSVLYLHSVTFRGMVLKLKNNLSSTGKAISVQSGSNVNYGRFSTRNSTIVLNEGAMPDDAVLLATLALHLTSASYLTHASAQGQKPTQYKEGCYSRLKSYYDEAGSALTDKGWGKQSSWVKKKSPQADVEVETPVTPQAEETTAEASVSADPTPSQHNQTPAAQRKSGAKGIFRGTKKMLSRFKF